MCGISGVFHFRNTAPINRFLVAAMGASLRHRGPDQSGLHIGHEIGLAHQRLSIIDLSAGQQPLCNEDGRVIAVYNGEIYNFQELMATLQKLGHRFRTRCDTEVIVHSWEEWGEQCVERFAGMFAFAVWDENKKTLFLARDRLGIKPLYYSMLPCGTFVFASELKALLRHPECPRELDPCAIEEYLAFGYIPDPRSIYAGVSKLEAGYSLTLQRNAAQPVIKRYWDVPFHRQEANADSGHELLSRMSAAVKSCLVSDVPVGAFLSGGVDSSTVVALMARASHQAPKTCSIAFTDSAFDESAYADLIAKRYRTDHECMLVCDADLQLLDQIIPLYDEPFADSSALPTYKVSELARRRVKVVLSGDGGDENFAGYRAYRLHRNKELVRAVLPPALRSIVFGGLGRLYPKADWAPQFLRAKATFQSLALTSVESFAAGNMICTDAERRALYSQGFLSRLQGYRAVETLQRHASQAPTCDAVSLAQYLDFKVYLPADILTKVDRASMAHGLEVRVPLLDHQLVEWVSGLDPSQKLRGAIHKYVMKKAMRSLLDAPILDRRKMGFSIPLRKWMDGPLSARLDGLQESAALLDSGLFRQERIAQLVHRQRSGLREHSAQLWSLLVLDNFLKAHGGKAAVTPEVSAAA